MGNYIDSTYLATMFGEDNILAWSDLTNASEIADSARIAAAINWAEAQIDDRFRRSRWEVPLSGPPEVVKVWAAKLAVVYLLQDPRFIASETARETREAFLQEVHNEMASYLSGSREFSATENGTHPTSPVVVGGDE